MTAFQNIWLLPAGLYLFLGGLSAGLYLVAGTACVLRQRRFSRMYRTAFLISAAMLAAGLVCLLVEVVKPAQALIVWRTFSNSSSWMMWGAWVAVGCIGIFGLTGIFECPGPSRWLRDLLSGVPFLREGLRIGFVVLGMVGAVFITVYTGFLLTSAGGVPFWNSLLLPPLFCVSAVNAGLSAMMALGVFTGRTNQASKSLRRTLIVVSLAVTVLEAALIAWFVLSMLAGGGFGYDAQRIAAALSAGELISGRFALSFWLLVPALGLAVPSAVFILGGFTGVRVPDGILCLAALLSVLSDMALRFLILYAGTYSDWFASVLATL